MTINKTVKMPWEKDHSGLDRGAKRYGSIENEMPEECAGPDCDTTGPRDQMHAKNGKNYCQECFDTLGLHES